VSEIGVGDAAANNAAWCHAVCGTHGDGGEFSESHWLTWSPAPPGYPNLVTLGRAVAPAMTATRALDRARFSASWAVKDSFAVLPLGQAGFRLLFEAEWVLRDSSAGPRRPPPGRWFRVCSEDVLSAWESAWGESRGQRRIFLPALLRRSDTAILAVAEVNGAITAGGIAHQAGNLVGLTNFFAHDEQRASARLGYIEAAMNTFPGLPIVSYEVGEALAEVRALKFVSLGPLRVWICET